MAILIVLLVYLLRDHVAQGTKDTCFSSAICYKADVHETTWRKLSPPPQCTRNSPTVESIKIIQIGRRLNRTIDRFFKRVADNCQACSSFENDISSANAFSDVERCFAPVVCQTDGMSRTDFIEIQPYPICAKDIMEVDDILMEREKLFNASRDYVATALQKHLEMCNPGCMSSKIQQVAKQIEEHNWKIHKGPKQCFAPVVCSAGDSSFQNWLKYPDCKYSTAILLSEEPENALSSILEVVFEDIRKLKAEECNGEICKEETTTTHSTATTTQSTNKHGDKISHQTTFAIQQGPSTQEDKTTSFHKETTKVPETSQPPSTLPKTKDSHEPATETTKESTAESATTLKPTCPPFTEPTTDDCKIVYNHKCYFWHKGSQLYTLEMAKQSCEDQGFNLGNIYDDCQYSYIVETVGKTTGNFWTGMNISFTPQGQRVFLRSGAFARFSDDWWHKTYPKTENGNNLLIEVKMKIPSFSFETGITNAESTREANGAFCEKDIEQ